MISQSAEYSLRAIVCLAQSPGMPLKTHQIAASALVPAGYLAKIMQALVRSGIVRSHRGINGGFILGRDPATLTLLEVVQVVDPPRRIRNCPLGLPSQMNLCPLHRHLDRAAALAEEALRGVTIADLPIESTDTKPSCDCQGVCRGPRGRLMAVKAGASHD